MNILIFGVGAIGGLVGASLKKGGARVGLWVRENSASSWLKDSVDSRPFLELQVPGKAKERIKMDGLYTSANFQEIEWDGIVLALKAQQLPRSTSDLEKFFQVFPKAWHLTIVNGIPWWYLPNPPSMRKPLDSVDPGGKVRSVLPVSQGLGGVAWSGAANLGFGQLSVPFPGRVEISELHPSQANVCAQLCDILDRSDLLGAEHTSSLLDTIWYKLLGNATINPISVIKNMKQDALVTEPHSQKQLHDLILEVIAVARACGIKKDFDPDQRLKAAAGAVGHTTSTHQDYLAGREMEIDPILGAVIELADRWKLKVPKLEQLFTELSGLPGSRKGE